MLPTLRFLKDPLAGELVSDSTKMDYDINSPFKGNTDIPVATVKLFLRALMVSFALRNSNSNTATLSSVPPPSSEYLVKSKLSRVT